MTEQISCDLHDYIEVACLYHYSLQVELKSGEAVTGVAETIVQKERQEFLQLQTPEGLVPVALTAVTALTVLTPNARFKRVVFV